MQKIIAAILALAAVFSMTACGNKTENPGETQVQDATGGAGMVVIPEEDTEPTETAPEEDPTTATKPTDNNTNIQFNPGNYVDSILQKSYIVYENPEIIDAYLTNDLRYIRTTDKRIIYRTYEGIWEVLFDYTNLENVREFFVLERSSEEYMPAYYDTDGVLHVLCKNVWYSCPEVTGTPYSCFSRWEYNGDIGEYETSIYVLSYERDKPHMQFAYNTSGYLGSQEYGSEQISFLELQYYHDHGGEWHHSSLYVINGELYVDCFEVNSHQVSLGVREEDVLTDLSHTDILVKGDDNTKIWKDNQETGLQHPLPEGKTVEQIALAATSDYATVVFFDDGSAYLYDLRDGDGQKPYYCEELSVLYRNGRIKQINSYFSMYIILDDNVPYSISSSKIKYLELRNNTQ